MYTSCAILIVDDSEADRVTYRRYLESSDHLGCDIFDCESAASALQFCDRTCPDVILLDYLLPDADGLELLQDLATQLGILPPVIMLTGQGSEAVAVAAMKQGVCDYIVKGQLTPQKLVTSVANALTQQKLQVQIDRHHQQRALLASIAAQISYSVELAQILQAAVQGARELLGSDRTLVYAFDPDMSGTIVAESVLPAWSPSLGQRLEDNCFQGEQSYQIDKYLQGYKSVIPNVALAPLTPCHLQMLRQYQVQAVLAVPILFHNGPPAHPPRLWGLLIAHHCQTVHPWNRDEINLMDELSLQMAIAIQQAELVIDLKATLSRQQIIEHQLRDHVNEIEYTNSQLSQTTRLLARRNQELDEFAYIVSHDLQAPLRGIANLTEWLKQDLGDQLPVENQQQVELIQSRVARMNALIHGLLEYARVDKAEIDTIPVNLSQLLAEVVDLLMPPPSYQVQFAADLPTIVTPALHLRQVLANLIGNAIKYHDRPDGQIEIRVTEQDTAWQFTVIDDGPGILPQHHHQIFGIFQTLAGSDAVKSTGIGLAIVKKIVESQGGTIRVESEIGQGSVFSFTWPKVFPREEGL
jgi:light-regulated signal transduction histidine kinase (bacteriophytochrome)